MGSGEGEPDGAGFTRFAARKTEGCVGEGYGSQEGLFRGGEGVDDGSGEDVVHDKIG